MCLHRVTVVLAIVGQTIAMVHRIYTQTNIDLFFIDWEKPRKVLARDGEYPQGGACTQSQPLADATVRPSVLLEQAVLAAEQQPKMPCYVVLACSPPGKL
jgi:hypothetical protein